MTLQDDIKNNAEGYGVTPGGGNSDFFAFEKGENKIRILNRPANVLATHFFGKGKAAYVCVGLENNCPYHEGEQAPKDDNGNVKKPSLKLVSYVIDRKDGKVKLAELPLSIGYAIQDLMNSEDYSFDEFPAPYDITVTYDPDNKDPKAIYRSLPSPKLIPLTEEENASFNEAMSKMSPEAYIEKRKEKAMPSAEATDDNLQALREQHQAEKKQEGEINPSDIPF